MCSRGLMGPIRIMDRHNCSYSQSSPHMIRDDTPGETEIIMPTLTGFCYGSLGRCP